MSAKGTAGSYPAAMQRHWAASAVDPHEMEGNWGLYQGWHNQHLQEDMDEVNRETKTWIDQFGNEQKVTYLKSNKHFQGYSASDDATLAEFAEETFNPENKRPVFTFEGCGHIKQLKYAPMESILAVTFESGTECTYFKVPQQVALTLIHLAKSKATNGVHKRGAKAGKPRHQLGIYFWKMIRVKHQRERSNYVWSYGNVASPHNKYKTDSNRHVITTTAENVMGVFGTKDRYDAAVKLFGGDKDALLNRKVTVVLNDDEYTKLQKNLLAKPGESVEDTYVKKAIKGIKSQIAAARGDGIEEIRAHQMKDMLNSGKAVTSNDMSSSALVRSKETDKALFKNDSIINAIDMRTGDIKLSLTNKTGYGIIQNPEDPEGPGILRRTAGAAKYASPSKIARIEARSFDKDEQYKQVRAVNKKINRELPAKQASRFTTAPMTKADLVKIANAEKGTMYGNPRYRAAVASGNYREAFNILKQEKFMEAWTFDDKED